jgi:hypothetical protein
MTGVRMWLWIPAAVERECNGVVFEELVSGEEDGHRFRANDMIDQALQEGPFWGKISRRKVKHRRVRDVSDGGLNEHLY